MTDDDRRLAQRLRAYESRVPDAPEPSTSFSRGGMPWGIAAIAAAALLAAVLIGGNLLNQRNVGNVDSSASPTPSPSSTAEPNPEPSPSPAPSSGPTPTAEPPTPVATPAPQPPITGVAWEGDVSATEAGFAARITAEAGQAFVLGSVDADGAIWSSSDGTTWQRSILPFPSEWRFGTDGGVYAHQLVSVGGRLVAIGTVSIADTLDVVVWESADGVEWIEIDTGDFRLDGFLVADLTNGPGGLVAVTNQYAVGTGSAWRSADGGTTWTEHAPPGDGVITTVAVGTTRGYLIGGAVGVDGNDMSTGAPRIWYSPDGMGTSWQPASLEGSDRQGIVEELAIDGLGRWVAIGVLDGRIVAWRSADRGLSWQLAADFGAAGVSTRADFRLVGIPDGFVAVSGTDPAVTWTSSDGAAWVQGPSVRPSGIPGDLQFDLQRGVARIGDLLIVAGEAYGPSGPPEQEWFAWRGTIQR